MPRLRLRRPPAPRHPYAHPAALRRTGRVDPRRPEPPLVPTPLHRLRASCCWSSAAATPGSSATSTAAACSWPACPVATRTMSIPAGAAAGRSTAAGGSPGQLPSPAGGARARLRAPRRTTGPSTSPAAARRGPRSGVVPAGSWSRWPSAMPRGTTSPRRGPPAASAGDRVPPPPDHVRTNEARRRTGGRASRAAPRHRSWGCDSRVAGKYCYFPAPSELDVR